MCFYNQKSVGGLLVKFAKHRLHGTEKIGLIEYAIFFGGSLLLVCVPIRLKTKIRVFILILNYDMAELNKSYFLVKSIAQYWQTNYLFVYDQNYY